MAAGWAGRPFDVDLLLMSGQLAWFGKELLAFSRAERELLSVSQMWMLANAMNGWQGGRWRFRCCRGYRPVPIPCRKPKPICLTIYLPPSLPNCPLGCNDSCNTQRCPSASIWRWPPGSGRMPRKLPPYWLMFCGLTFYIQTDRKAWLVSLP